MNDFNMFLCFYVVVCIPSILYLVHLLKCESLYNKGLHAGNESDNFELYDTLKRMDDEKIIKTYCNNICTNYHFMRGWYDGYKTNDRMSR